MIRQSRRVSAALAWCSLLLWAQPPPPVSAELVAAYGLYKVVFQVPEGRISVTFPNDVTAGDTILAMVYLEPSGENPKERERNSASLSGYTVAMDGAKISGGRLRWSVPPRVASGTVRLQDRKRTVLTHCDVPVAPRGAENPQPAATGRIALPQGARAGAAVSLWGSFPEDVVPTIRVGGFAALVIAQSPRRIVFVSPPDVVGASKLEVTFGGAASVGGPFHVLGMRYPPIPRTLDAGQTAGIAVTVSGLNGLAAPAIALICVTASLPRYVFVL